MRIKMKKIFLRRFASTRKATMLCVMAVGLSFFLLPFAAYWSQQAAGVLSGSVFQDFNGNGVFDTAGSAALPAIDAAVQNVTVTVFAPNGTSKSTTTLANGTWSIDTSAAPALPAGPYRVEFTNLPANFLPSARSTDSVLGGTATNAGSTVQFVNNVATSNINLAVNVAEDYCQNNPTLCTSIFRPGNQSQNRSTTISVPYDAPSANTNLATESQTGTVYGTAYQGSTKTIFQSAYMKRHSGFGSLGTGGIYKINLSSGSPVFSTYVNLQTIGLNTGTDPRVTAGYALPNTGSTPNWDYAAYTEVGKRAIGDLDYDAARKTLWFINLNDRRLHGIKNVNPNITPTNADLVRDPSNNLGFNVNTSTPITCTNGVLRPFGIEIYRGLVYVGAVCTGENAGATAANLVAYVLSINPDNPGAGFTQVLSFPLNYTRTKINFGGDAPWNPWLSSDSSRVIAGGALPQPIISDLEIDKDGSIIMAIKDRWGDQYAASQYRPDTTQTSTTLVTEIYGFGDMLRFCNNGGTLSNPGTAGCPNNPRPSAENAANAGGSQGPGGGEFYVGDWGPTDPDNFGETMHGALAFLPGSNRVVATSLDPTAYYSNGLKWLSNTDGSKLSAYNTFTGSSNNTTNDFNKGNGLGDLELLCDSAPIEVGNRVWADTNANGVQDSGESPISGVTVQFWADTDNNGTVDTLVGTAVTDANGEYYFVGSTSPDSNTTDNIGQVNGGIFQNTAYQVRIPASNFTTGQPLASRTLSPADNDGSINGDSRDSDGIPSSGNAVANFTTGGGGSNNHTFDFGFYLAPTAANVTVGGRVASASGSGLRGVLVALTQDNGTTRTAMTNTFGYYRFDDIPAGQTVTVSVSSKRYIFKQPTQIVNVSDSIADLDFVSDSR